MAPRAPRAAHQGAPAGSEMVKLNVYSLSSGQPFAPRRSSELLFGAFWSTVLVQCKHWVYWK